MAESKKKEIVAVEPQKMKITKSKDVASVENFISQAIEAKLPMDQMERLLAMRSQVKAEYAKEAFINAMSNFQSRCPIIQKNKDVNDKTGKLRYSYASLDSIVSQVREILGSCGLAYTTSVINDDGFITAVCKITHNLGHSEESAFKIPIDKEGFMSAPQKYAAALTFAKRYAFCNALGILTGEDDDDAGTVGKKPEIDTIKHIKGKIFKILKELDVNTDSPDLKNIIKTLTGIIVDDNEKNLNEIYSRLTVLLDEKNSKKA